MIESSIHLFILRLNDFGLDYGQIRNAEIEVRESINNIIIEVMSGALNDFSSITDSDDPLKHIEIREISGYPQLCSDNGSFDSSTPSHSMLPALLQNAKVSKEGFRYKVIPIGKSSNRPQDQVKDVDSGIKAMRDNAPSMEEAVASIASAFNAGASTVSKTEPKSMSNSGPQAFRTASEKQDASNSWMIASKEVKIDFEIHRINGGIISQLEQEVKSILDNKLEEFK